MQILNEDECLQDFIKSFNLVNQCAPFFNSFVKNRKSQYVAVSRGFLELSAHDLLDMDQKDLQVLNFEARMLKTRIRVKPQPVTYNLN